ncbi:MAG: hypothetical protein JXR34_09820 [Bacteroidales bacterium]|nr:hypothetical protein [Bacteroidales bacterium]
MNKIGIRHEDKYLLERRVALTPDHVHKLILNAGLEFFVQSSAKRVFKDKEYQQAGAIVVDDFSEDVKTIFGVKEMPINFFKENQTLVFFSHTIKGQTYNMPMLRAMMDKKINLIDYERISDGNKRLIFFGRFAGIAGAINSIWALGMRYHRKNINTPFYKLRQAHTYSSLPEAIEVIKEISSDITTNGLPKEISPLIIGITGYGNVSKGAQEILDLLPFKEITPEELLHLDLKSCKNNAILKVVFQEKDLSLHQDGKDFELQDYYKNPHNYFNRFEDYVPKLSMLLNCMYWDPAYPRIVTKKYLQKHFSEETPRLEVIGDITCDPDGSIECTHTGTPIVNPVYVYNPLNMNYKYGFEGDGLLIMAVDILPSELPRESSQAFGDALLPFVAEIATADFSASFEELKLPEAIKRALILHNGEFTPAYKYMNKYLINTNK